MVCPAMLGQAADEYQFNPGQPSQDASRVHALRKFRQWRFLVKAPACGYCAGHITAVPKP